MGWLADEEGQLINEVGWLAHEGRRTEADTNAAGTSAVSSTQIHHINQWSQIHHTNWWGQIHHTNWWGQVHHINW